MKKQNGYFESSEHGFNRNKVAKELLKIARNLIADNGGGELLDKDEASEINQIFNKSDFQEAGKEVMEGMKELGDECKDMAEDVEELKEKGASSKLFIENHSFVAKFKGEVKLASDTEYKPMYEINVAAEDVYYKMNSFIASCQRYADFKKASALMIAEKLFENTPENQAIEDAAHKKTLELADAIKEKIASVIKGLQDFMEMISEKAKSVKEWLSKKAHKVIKGVFDIGKFVGKGILLGIGAAIWAGYKLVKGAFNLCASGVKAILKVSRSIGEAISAQITKIGEALEKLYGEIKSGIEAMGQDIEKGAEIIVHAINVAVFTCKGVANAIVDIFKNDYSFIGK